MSSSPTTVVSGERARWTPNLVTAATLHPINIRLCANAPYVRELYDRLPCEAVHPSRVRDWTPARPLRIRRGTREYYLPGNADDLLLHTSCVVAGCPAVIESLPADADSFDFAPPLLSELAEGSFGRHRLSRDYWVRMRRAMEPYWARGYSHVLFTDISRCYESVRTERMLALLRKAGADSDAVRTLAEMHRHWEHAGCRGLPLAGGSRVLFKLYIDAADRLMFKEGFAFLRHQDNYRLFCRGENDASRLLVRFGEILATVGLSVNARKTRLFTRDELRRRWRSHRLDWRRLFRSGIGLPLLSESLSVAALRPVAFRLLRLLYGHQCWPA